MTATYNVYCDESGHLTNVGKVMVLGALWCPVGDARRLSDRLRELKKTHGHSPAMEAKWTKVSPAGFGFYKQALDLFFEEPALRFRALVVPDKGKLRHEAYNQDHDTWYYKMYYSMLKVIVTPDEHFRLYLDIKDTRSAEKMRKLHEVLCNSVYDFDQTIIERVQTVRSHEVELLQLADLLIGAVQYANRGLQTSPAKESLVRHIRERSRYSLVRSTLLTEKKLNIFCWQPGEAER